MGRIFLLLALLVIALLAINTLARTVQHIAQPSKTGDTLPMTFQRIAYVLLILLMFGIAFGWLGAA